jgi:N-acetyl-gamma-glutamyl-phosphate reductase
MQIKVGIIGGAGYTGGELIRLLINHPHVSISFVHSRSNAGNPVYAVHSDLVGETDLQFTNELMQDVDVIFLCAGHGAAKKFLSENEIDPKIKLIDLSHDFRLSSSASFKKDAAKNDPQTRRFIYGLPELNKEKIKTANYIANPGCFATAIMLGLLPLAKAGLLTEVYSTGITGSTGAGQGLSATSHFSWRSNNIQAYKTLEHQHLNEIHESLHQLQETFPANPSTDGGINFIPWRGDFPRGIFISSQIHCDESAQELMVLYNEFYKGQPFVYSSKEPIFLKQVVNTNKCVIQLEKVGSKLIVHSALDNLLKGASGQAVQNMNLLFGIEETAGLKLKASAF